MKKSFYITMAQYTNLFHDYLQNNKLSNAPRNCDNNLGSGSWSDVWEWFNHGEKKNHELSLLQDIMR